MKRYGMVLAMLLALPGMANAWYLNAKSANTTQGTVTPSGTKYVATGASSAEYVVTPKTTAYKISKVTLDGAVLAPNANGNYVAPYNAAKAYRYLVAYFTANVNLYNITTTAGANGAVYEDTYESLTNIPAGASRQILVVPNTGFSIADLTVSAGGVVTDTANGKLVTFATLADNQSVSATFAQTPVFNINAGADITLPSYNTVGNVFGAVDTNLGAATYTWTSEEKTATSGTVTTTSKLVFDNPNDINSAFRISATTSNGTAASFKTGTYAITLTAVSGGQTKTDSLVVTFLDGKAANLNTCTACHNNNTPEFIAGYVAGAHGVASGHETGTCQRCHATTGAQVGFAQGWVGGYTQLMADQATVWTPNQPLISDNGISCAVCHNAHDGLNAVTGWDPNANQANNDQYDVCTACHTLNDNSGAVVGNYHEGYALDVARTISDSHYDDPATIGLEEGYVLRKNSATPCADCHNLHTASVVVQEAWGESAHAGKILAKKAEAACAPSITYFNATYVDKTPAVVDAAGNPVTAATSCTEEKSITGSRGVSTETVLTWYGKSAAGIAFYKTVGAMDDADGNAWSHYNWDKTSKLATDGTTVVDDRGSCQHCHTSTGAANFLKAATAGTVYSPTNNDFSHLNGWTALGGSNQQELLYCWGCHSDAQTGALNATGAITVDYKVNGLAKSLTAADAGKSAACISCHSGRGNANSLLGAAAMNPAGASIASPATKSHYLAAGLTINQVELNAGYTFGRPATDYADAVYFAHKNLGCAECHMTSAKSHTFDVVEKDAAGVITKVASSKCIECHDGEHGPALSPVDVTTVWGSFTAAAGAAFLEEEAEGFHQALEVLKNALLAKGFTVTAGYPYIGAGTNADFLNQGNSGAAYNYSYLHHEPGAFAHNSVLAKRLIFDSIDWLDNGVLDNTIAIDELTFPAARAWYGAVSGASVARP
uniref:Uncharacterized protein n=1 Tax=Geobacter sp. (strain M21) TaxID=443144 RepID=C6E3J1_GEOSM